MSYVLKKRDIKVYESSLGKRDREKENEREFAMRNEENI